MAIEVLTRQEVRRTVEELPDEVLPELASFLAYLRFKTGLAALPEPRTEATDHTDFLLSLVGIGVKDERLAHIEALIQARRLHAEIELNPTQAITHEELMQTLGAVE